MREIQLLPEGCGLVMRCSDGDYDLLARYRWRRHVDKKNGKTYARRHWYEDGHQRGQFAHVLIMGALGVDHMDHDGLNNQRDNLRLATHRQNHQNRRKQRGSSRFKGVCRYAPTRRWVAAIFVNGRRLSLGYHLDEEEAARAYDSAALEYFGEFACTNESLGLFAEASHG